MIAEYVDKFYHVYRLMDGSAIPRLGESAELQSQTGSNRVRV